MSAIDRRSFLGRLGATFAAGFVAPALRPEIAVAAGAPPRHTIVLVVLDGGLDGLSALVPAGDPNYVRLRPTTAVRQPMWVSETFGLHPALQPLWPLWQAGEIAAVPALGRPGCTRSHFQESAVLADGRDGGSSDGSGWLARHLLSSSGGQPVTLQGVSNGEAPSPELLGHRGAIYVPDVSRTTVPLWDHYPAMSEAMASTYGAAGPDLRSASAIALEALRRLEESGAAALPPGVPYADDPWSRQLAQIGQLLRADVAVEAAVVRFGGWDTHSGQVTRLDRNLSRLASALASFRHDVADRWHRITVVVMSEFGRRAAENGSGGTDHGTGGLGLVMGNGIRGGVHGPWPGLGEGSLVDGDVPATVDVRSLLAEVVSRRAGNPDLAAVFPGFSPTPVGFA